jgi:hypothetical protein
MTDVFLSVCLSCLVSSCSYHSFSLSHGIIQLFNNIVRHQQRHIGPPGESIYSSPFKSMCSIPDEPSTGLQQPRQLPISKKPDHVAVRQKNADPGPKCVILPLTPLRFFQTNPQSKWHSVVGRNQENEETKKRQDKNKQTPRGTMPNGRRSYDHCAKSQLRLRPKG